MMFFLATQDPSISPSVRRRTTEMAEEILAQGLKDPNVSDERKYSLGPVLALLGHELSRKDYEACFRDFDGVAEKLSREHMTQIPDTLEHLETSLRMAGLINHGSDGPCSDEALLKALAVAAETAKHNPNVGVTLLAVTAAIAHEQGKSGEVWALPTALEIIADTRTERAAWLLGEIGRLPGMGQLGEHARSLAEDMRKVGVIPRGPTVGEFSHGLVSGLDGAGSQNLSLFFKTEEGGLHSLVLLVNDQVGIKDAFGVFDEATDLEEGIRAQGLTLAPCDVALARELVGDALVRHEKAGRPLPGRFLLYRAFLGQEPIPAQERRPQIGAYMLETVVPGPEIVEGSEELMDHPLYSDLGCVSDEAYEFVSEARRKTGRKAKTSHQILERYTQTVAIKEKHVLAHRLAVNLEVEARAGRAQKPVNRLAARTWLALTENIVPFHEIPYVQALCRQSMSAIKMNLKHGYRNQREANERARALADGRPLEGLPKRPKGGRRCGLCGSDERLTKTECCGNWICDDEDEYVVFSYARNSCHRNHRCYTLCGAHHAEEHGGRWQDCIKCQDGFEAELYVYYGTNEYNFEVLANPPAYEPTSCSRCDRVIRLGYDAYCRTGDDYRCERCSEEELGVLRSLRDRAE
jgi:hypothetical protein